MIKTIEKITIGDYNRMETTGRINQYKEWYNFLPIFFFKKRFVSLVSEITKLINDNELDVDVDREEWKLKSFLKIQELDALYFLIINHLINGVQFKKLIEKIKIERKNRRKLKYDGSESLGKTINRVKEMTGIDITGIDDVLTLKEHIEHIRDKWNEMFKQKFDDSGNEKKITLLEYASSFVIYSGNSFTGLLDMKILELVAMKKEAEKKYKAEQKAYDKINKIDG